MNLNSLDPIALTAIAAVVSYLVGSLSFAVIVSRLFGLADPRTYGSGNPGATKVLRSGNKAAAILTLLFDAVKGYVPVIVALRLGLDQGLSQQVVAAAGLGAADPEASVAVAAAHQVGAGGAGAARAAGVLLGFAGALGGLVLLVWIAMAAIFRYSSLAALTASLAAPLIQIYLQGVNITTAVVVIMSALLIWRHEANIRKLLAGQESKLGQKA